MGEVIIIGQNYNTSLGLIKSIGEGGFKCATVKFKNNSSTLRAYLQVLFSPDLCSKYVKRWVQIPREPEETLIKELIANFGDKTNKKLILPADDYCAHALDKNHLLLKEYFHVPHITDGEHSLGYYMDKQNQKKIAEKCDMDVSKTWSVKITKGVNPIIPDDVVYPCITKPQSSIGLPKSYIQKCCNIAELQNLLNNISQKSSCEILIEEYIEVEEEFTIPGISNGIDVLIPSFLKKIVIDKSYHKGVTICGRVENSSKYQNVCSKLITLMKIIGFSGIFDIELLKSGNKFYLNEINFRNGAAGLSLTKAGINLPSIYVSYILNEKPFYFSYTHFKEVTFVNDKAAFEYYLMGGFTKSEYKDLLRKVSIQLIDNKDDRLAQLSFNLLRYKTLLFSLIK